MNYTKEDFEVVFEPDFDTEEEIVFEQDDRVLN